MARTLITAQPLLGAYPDLPLTADSADVSWTATDGPTDLQVAIVDGKTIVEVYNSDDAATHTVTFTASPDAQNRTVGIAAYVVGALQTSRFGPFKSLGWQVGGMLGIDVSDPLLRVNVLNSP
jgi:hypothetical protein